jgi:hypothetical protein
LWPKIIPVRPLRRVISDALIGITPDIIGSEMWLVPSKEHHPDD